MKRFLVLFTFFFLAFCLGASLGIVRADSISLFKPDMQGKVISPPSMVNDFYNLALAISGILAFGAIVYGGIIYATSGGNPSRQSDARDQIWQAFLGILLLLGAYFIFKIINPRINTLQIDAPPSSSILRYAFMPGAIKIFPADKKPLISP